jgi:hypothetical protein
MSNTSVVSIQTLEQGYAFELDNGSQVWTVELSKQTYRALSLMPNDSVFAMSTQGKQIADVIAELEGLPVGTLKAIGPAPEERPSCKNLQASNRKLGLVGGSFLMVLAITMFALGYHAITDLSKFLFMLVKSGGEPGTAAYALITEPMGLFMQNLLVVVVPTVVLLMVGARQVRTAIALPK